jgi:hypothetical protein
MSWSVELRCDYRRAPGCADPQRPDMSPLGNAKVGRDALEHATANARALGWSNGEGVWRCPACDDHFRGVRHGRASG